MSRCVSCGGSGFNIEVTNGDIVAKGEEAFDCPNCNGTGIT